jgi:transporter family protein
MTQWLTPTLLALLSFGMWGFFSKLTIDHIDTRSALIFQTMGVLIIGLIAMTTLEFKLNSNIKGLTFGLLTGIAYAIGCFFYLVAAGKGKLSTVVTLTALYPLITLALSYFLLKEELSLKQCLGIVCALIAIYLLVD